MKAPNRLMARCTVVAAMMLVCAGSSISCASKSRMAYSDDATPLIKAVERGKENRVERLLEDGADVNEVDEKGMTPLHHAARRGHDDMTHMLLARGASVNAQDQDGNTPLHLAAKSNHDETMVELLIAGANRSVRNKEGKTPADLASARLITLVQP